MDERILVIETHAMLAWPPLENVSLDGWQLRAHTVPSRRVNSVWPNAWYGHIPLALKLEQVEAYYFDKSQPARYQVCPAALPAGLDDVLAARGYETDARTGVQVGAAESVYAAAGARMRDDPAIEISESLTLEWAETYCRVQGAPISDAPKRMEALGRIGLPSVYVSINVDGVRAAVGRGVRGEGWLGIFGMATQEDFRRRGLATAVLRALAATAIDHRVDNLYLQVMDENAAARQLYAGLGFSNLYHYHYRFLEKHLTLRRCG